MSVLLEIGRGAEIHHRQLAGGVLQLERLPLLGHEPRRHHPIRPPLRRRPLQRRPQNLPVIQIANVERRLRRMVDIRHHPARFRGGRDQQQDGEKRRPMRSHGGIGTLMSILKEGLSPYAEGVLTSKDDV